MIYMGGNVQCLKGFRFPFSHETLMTTVTMVIHWISEFQRGGGHYCKNIFCIIFSEYLELLRQKIKNDCYGGWALRPPVAPLPFGWFLAFFECLPIVSYCCSHHLTELKILVSNINVTLILTS